MPDLDVAKGYDHTLKVNCTDVGLRFRMEYDSGLTYPWNWLYVSWEQWDRLVAWIEWQRKEEAYQKVKQKES